MVFGDAIFHEIEGLQALRVQSEAQADDQGALPAEADPCKAAFSSPRGRVACARNSPSTQAMSQLLYMEVCRRFQQLCVQLMDGKATLRIGRTWSNSDAECWSAWGTIASIMYVGLQPHKILKNLVLVYSKVYHHMQVPYDCRGAWLSVQVVLAQVTFALQELHNAQNHRHACRQFCGSAL